MSPRESIGRIGTVVRVWYVDFWVAYEWLGCGYGSGCLKQGGEGNHWRWGNLGTKMIGY